MKSQAASEFTPPAQAPVPHRCPDSTNFCLTDAQMQDNLRVYWNNHCAWPKEPLQGFPGMFNAQDSNQHVYETAAYGMSGLEATWTSRFHATPGNEHKKGPSLKDHLDAIGVNWADDKNPGNWAG